MLDTLQFSYLRQVIRILSHLLNFILEVQTKISIVPVNSSRVSMHDPENISLWKNSSSICTIATFLPINSRFTGDAGAGPSHIALQLPFHT